MPGSESAAGSAWAAIDRLGIEFPVGEASGSVVGQLGELLDASVYAWRPMPVPISFLVDRERRVSVIYRGSVTVPQLLKDVELLEAEPLTLEAAAYPFPGRGSAALFPQGAISRAVACWQAGFADDAAQILRRHIEATRGSSRMMTPPLGVSWGRAITCWVWALEQHDLAEAAKAARAGGGLAAGRSACGSPASGGVASPGACSRG